MNFRDTRIGTALVVFQFSVVVVLGFICKSDIVSVAQDYFDAAHYHAIATQGYADYQLAFFPGFPGLWSLFGCGVLAIALFNSCIYFLSFWFLSRTLKWTTTEVLVAALSPCIVFYFIPYTEALFFAASGMVLVGLHRENLGWTAVGLFLCALVRPTVSVLIIGLLLLEIIRARSVGSWLRNSMIWLLSGMAGVMTTFLIQYGMTGKWFEFFEAQKLWGNELQWLHFPLSSWAGHKIVLLDAAACAVGVGAIILVLRWLFQRYQKREIAQSPVVVLSALYLAGVTAIVLLFRGGELFSLNRFVFASPFFMVFLVFLIRQNWSKKSYWIIGGLFGFFILFGSFGHIQTMLSFSALTFGLALPLFFNHPKRVLRVASLSIFTVGSIIVQIALILRFMNGEWIG